MTLSDTYTLKALLWMSDQPDQETSAYQKAHSQEIVCHTPGGIRTRNLSGRLAASPHFRQRGHLDRQERNA
jgi:hypothetical protein